MHNGQDDDPSSQMPPLWVMAAILVVLLVSIHFAYFPTSN